MPKPASPSGFLSRSGWLLSPSGTGSKLPPRGAGHHPVAVAAGDTERACACQRRASAFFKLCRHPPAVARQTARNGPACDGKAAPPTPRVPPLFQPGGARQGESCRARRSTRPTYRPPRPRRDPNTLRRAQNHARAPAVPALSECPAPRTRSARPRYATGSPHLPRKRKKPPEPGSGGFSP